MKSRTCIEVGPSGAAEYPRSVPSGRKPPKNWEKRLACWTPTQSLSNVSRIHSPGEPIASMRRKIDFPRISTPAWCGSPPRSYYGVLVHLTLTMFGATLPNLTVWSAVIGLSMLNE